jgi:uncharacterized protein YabE (DUF348 family)
MMKGKMPPGAAGGSPATTAFAAKGRATVNGFACTNYEGTRAGQKVSEICAAQPADLKITANDYQVFRKMQEFADGLRKAMQNSPLAGALNLNVAQSGVDGFPVQSTTFENGQVTRKEVVKSVADAALTDAEFSVGSARKTEMPDMTGGGRGRGRGK